MVLNEFEYNTYKLSFIIEEITYLSMKFACTLTIGNRQLATIPIYAKEKPSKSTLALCKHPSKDAYFIILFNNQNPHGKKYQVTRNVLSVRTNFVSEGKATLQFEAPPHDFYIQTKEVLQLKVFLHAVRCSIQGVSSGNPIASSFNVTPSSVKNLLPTKLIIKKRSDYPANGFPRTLEHLKINDIGRASLDQGILKLSRLVSLDLSHNCIEFLPNEFSNLTGLQELNLGNNMFGKGSPAQWGWISGSVAKNLKLLDLCHNTLAFLPDNFIKFTRLITLHLDHNELKSLPSGIGNMSCMQVFTVSYNLLESLPGTVKRWKLSNIDLSHNKFTIHRGNDSETPAVKHLRLCSLKEYSGKAVLNYKLHYAPGTIPATLIRYLERAKYCICGKACFDVFILGVDRLYLQAIAKNYTHTSESPRIPISCHFCSVHCLMKYKMRFAIT
ncbi:hypothetical protein AMK59_1264 [Oryctes borbonicus]|uniref:PIF1/LRR1 pleckstrin homology domain-containing protein n=1 Tax=Oryctes borbonicus TaxID=1629725 RepID=A0A0T6BFC1_9SCAR|nr:hypothetical protein AMK59_1264 [Oryctes borbonicus]